MAINASRRIALAVDGSPCSEKAIDWYLDNLHKEGDFVFLIHCVEAPNLAPMTLKGGFNVPVDNWTKQLEERIQGVGKLKDQLYGLFEERRIPCEFLALTASKPGVGILCTSDEQKANLIVLGSTGMGAIKRAVYGSVSDYVLHNTKIPVCIVIN